MRLERQPSLQLRESLNVCWEGWRERESARDRKRRWKSGKKSSGWREQELPRLWKVQLKKGRTENEDRWVSVHKAAGSEEKRIKGRIEEKRCSPFLIHSLKGEAWMCEIQSFGNSLLWRFSSALSAVSLSSLRVRKGTVQTWSIFSPLSSSFLPLLSLFLLAFQSTILPNHTVCWVLDQVDFKKQYMKLIFMFAAGFLIWLYFSYDFCWLNKSYEHFVLDLNTLFVLTITTLLKFFIYELILCKKNLLFLPRQMKLYLFYN